MRQGYLPLLLSLILFLTVCTVTPGMAEMVLEWEYNLSSLGQLWAPPGEVSFRVAEDGTTTVAYYTPTPGNGIGVAMIDAEGNLAWQYSNPTDHNVFHHERDQTGETYVAAVKQFYGDSASGASTLMVIKIDNEGNEVWSTTYRSSSGRNSYGLGNFAVDSDGNAWVSSQEIWEDTYCLEYFDPGYDQSAFSLVRFDAATGSASQVEQYYPDVGTGAWGSTLVADPDGYIYAHVTLLDYCCGPDCSGCYDNCYADGILDSTNYRHRRFIYRYTIGGAGGELRALSNSETNNRYGLMGDRFGNPWLVRKFTDCEDINCWSRSYLVPLDQDPGTEIEANVGTPLFDYNGNAIFHSYPSDGVSASGPGIVPAYEVYYVNGQTGAIDWTLPGGNELCADRDGYVYVNNLSGDVVKYTAAGVEVDRFTSPPDMGGFLAADADNNLYFRFSDRLKKFVMGKTLEIVDVNGDPMADMEFTLSTVSVGAPVFNFAKLGTFTSDSDGRVDLEVDAESTYAIDLNTGRHVLNETDQIRISKHVHAEPARRHSGGMFNIHLDNAKFDATGVMSYEDLSDGVTQQIVMDHTEIRYNLWASLEWRATPAYINNFESGVRNMSNYLYDVTDGQMRFDSLTIYTGGHAAVLADMYIKASNVEWAYCENGVGGVFQRTHETPKRIIMPRKFYGDSTTARNRSYSDAAGTSGVLDVNTPTDYRTKIHEFGHYALSFYDEYLFWNDGLFGLFEGYERDDGGNLRCMPRSVMTYGFMDYQYDYGGGIALGYTTEMSSKYRYVSPDCRNTKQYREYGRSCWEHLELLFENMDWGPEALRVPILKPDFDDDDERHDLSPINTFVGPNNDLANPDYNVGARLVVDDHSLPVGTDYINKKIRAAGLPQLDRCDVLLLNKLGSSGTRSIYQGRTADDGWIWVLGLYEPDYRINVTKRNQVGRWTTTIRGSGSYFAPNSTGSWLSGSIVNQPGDSAVVAITEISADYPLLVDATFGAGSVELVLIAETPFPESPTLSLASADSGLFAYTFGAAPTGYTVSVSDSLGFSGNLLVDAVDGSLTPFFFSCPYNRMLLPTDTTSPHLSIVAPSGLAEFLIDTVNGSLVEALLISSDYPVPLTGVGDQAVQVSAAYTLALEPDIALDSTNQVLIRYYEDDLIVDGGVWAGYEAGLGVYHWDEAGSTWVRLESAVDTLGNMVAAEIDRSGIYTLFTEQVVSDVDDDEHGQNLPYRFELKQNYPNPFNPATTIEYAIPERSHVKIEVLNILGQVVATLVDAEISAGLYTAYWNGEDQSGQPVATGVYLYRFQASEYSDTRKMLLLK